MDLLEHELRALNQARFATDGIHFDSIEGQGWMNRVFQERLDELEVELFDTGALRTEEATKTTFVPLNLETRLISVPAMPHLIQSSCEQEQRSIVLDRLGEIPLRRSIHPRRRLGPLNKTTSGPSRFETVTSTSREERHQYKSFLMSSSPIPSPWHAYKQILRKLNLKH